MRLRRPWWRPLRSAGAPTTCLACDGARAHANPLLRPPCGAGPPFVTSLAFINSVINPLLYVFTCPDVLRRSCGARCGSVLERLWTTAT